MRSGEIPSAVMSLLATVCLEDSKRWFPGETNGDLVHHTLSMAGEVGEVANIVKKIQRGDLKLSDAVVLHDLREEVVDVFIYLLNLAGILNIDLYKGFAAKRAINEKRWGNGQNG